MFTRVAALGLRWPRAVVGFLLLATLLAVLELREFRLEPDISRLLPQGREVRLFRAIEERTAGGRSLLIAVRGDSLARVESDLAALAARLRESPYLAEVLATRTEILGTPEDLAAPLWGMDDAARERLRERLTSGRREALERMFEDLASDPLGGAELAARDPLGVRDILGDAARRAMPVQVAESSLYLVLGDGHIGVLRAVGEQPPYDAEFARAMLEDVERRLAPADCDMWGGYVVAREQATNMQHDMTWSTVTSSLVVGLYLAWVMGSLLAAPLVLLPTLLAVVWALPLGGFLFGPFNVIAVGAAAVLVGLGVDFSIHFLARYTSERRRAAPPEATLAAVAHVGTPIFLGALTTCGAFLSLTLGEFQGLAGFGALLSLGLLLAMLLLFVVSPVLLRSRRFDRLRPPASPVADALARFAGTKLGALAGAGLAALGVAGLVAAATVGLRFDVDADALGARTSAAGEVRTRIVSALGFSPVPTTLLLDADLAPERIQAGLERLRQQGTVVFVDGPQRWLPTSEQAAAVARFRAASSGWVEGTLADLAELGAVAAGFEPGLRRIERLLDKDPGPVPDRYRIDDGGEQRLLAFCYTPRTVRSEDAWRQLETDVHAAFSGGAEPFGSFALLGEVRRLLLHDLRTCVLATALLVVASTLLLVRGHWLGWLALLPVVIGTGITLGVLIWFDVPLNLANFVAVPFLLGIGVDDGIHVAHHFRRAERAEGLGDTAVAIWRTSVTTALAFGSLMTSSMQGLWTLGLITSVGVVACLLASFLVMVPLARHGARSAA